MVNQRSFELGNKGSAIRELFEYGKKRKQEIGEDKVFDYSLGNPSIPCPTVVTETLTMLLKTTDPTNLHAYTSAPGDIKVRKAISDYINNTYGVSESENLIYLTCGAAASLTISLNAIINEGDEVIVLAPFFPEYKVFAEKAMAKVNIVECDKETFQIDFDKLSKAINKNTKAIIINSPNNPSGVIFKEESIVRLSNLLREKENEYNNQIFIICDEPYRELVYDDYKVPYITKYYNDSLVCYSFSKSLSLPGDRIGYILVSSKCENAIEVFKAVCGSGRSLGYVCAPSLFQQMIPYCIGKTSDISIYKQNREMLYNALTEFGYDVIYPDGAFYIFVKSLDEDANKFSEYAKKYELLLVPSDSFGVKGYVRLAYCVSPMMIKNSLDSFKRLINDYKKK